jgi:hypothetical protein
MVNRHPRLVPVLGNKETIVAIVERVFFSSLGTVQNHIIMLGVVSFLCAFSTLGFSNGSRGRSPVRCRSNSRTVPGVPADECVSIICHVLDNNYVAPKCLVEGLASRCL